VRIVDDFSDQVYRPVRKFVDGLIRIVHCAVDAVAEPKLLSESDRDVSKRIRIAAGSNAFNQRRLILGVDQGAKLFFEPEALPEVCLLHGREFHAESDLTQVVCSWRME
jgi:hypothetical protein